MIVDVAIIAKNVRYWEPDFMKSLSQSGTHYKRDQFRDFLFPLRLIVARDSGGKAVVGMIGQKLGFDFAQRGLHSLHLCQNINAIAVILDHFGNASDLPFNTRKSATDARAA